MNDCPETAVVQGGREERGGILSRQLGDTGGVTSGYACPIPSENQLSISSGEVQVLEHRFGPCPETQACGPVAGWKACWRPHWCCPLVVVRGNRLHWKRDRSTWTTESQTSEHDDCPRAGCPGTGSWS